MFSKFEDEKGVVVLARNVVGVHVDHNMTTTIICIGTTIKCKDPRQSLFKSVSKTIQHAIAVQEESGSLTFGAPYLTAAFLGVNPVSKQSFIDFHICDHPNNIYTVTFQTYGDALRTMHLVNSK
jgi:hypothetical protein